jgi:hypothetical protein
MEDCGCTFEMHVYRCWRLLGDSDRFFETSQYVLR